MSRFIDTVRLSTSIAVGLALFTSGAAVAEGPFDSPEVSNGVTVSLIQQDGSDCTNSTVVDNPDRTRGGEVWVTSSGGMVTVQVGMTVNPDTIYNFYLKCVQQLGTIITDDEGIGLAKFTFPASIAGNVFAFDMYPDGAVPGNKFQSMTVTLN